MVGLQELHGDMERIHGGATVKIRERITFPNRFQLFLYSALRDLAPFVQCFFCERFLKLLEIFHIDPFPLYVLSTSKLLKTTIQKIMTKVKWLTVNNL